VERPRCGAIGHRIEEATRLREKADAEGDTLLLRQTEELGKGAPCVPLGQVAPIVRRAVQIRLDAWYPELGIRSFGKGTFHKPAVLGGELGGKRIFRIEPGDLLFSNVFAWEGAIAVAQPEDVDRFGSHRFITCAVDPDQASPEFICRYFLTAEGLAHIRAASPGAAGRNKTLGIRKLEAVPVPLPPVAEQRRFAELVLRVCRARAAAGQTMTEMKALMPAVLDRVFRGQL